jgi:hypothetical protein
MYTCAVVEQKLQQLRLLLLNGAAGSHVGVI